MNNVKISSTIIISIDYRVAEKSDVNQFYLQL